MSTDREKQAGANTAGQSELIEQLGAWQPIETAPKDGTDILILTKAGIIQAFYAPGEWSHGYDGDEYDGPVWVCYNDSIEIEIEEAPDGHIYSDATHWMPLPAPPEST